MSTAYSCREARLAIGGDPRHLPPDALRHVEGCAACARFLAETLAMDDRLRTALELPLHRFRRPPPARRLALAASVLLAVLVGGGLWTFWPQPTLAGDVLEHLRHEPDSWNQQRRLTAGELAPVLREAGIELDPTVPVVYASSCAFRGHVVPHLVVQSASGPMTVMILAHEQVTSRREFSEGDYRGVLLPAPRGGIAVITRHQAAEAGEVQRLLNAVR